MPLFKLNASSSKKNKTASAANTPAQTPRTSFDGKAPATVPTGTPATQASQAAAAKAFGNMQAMVLSRV
ncbi:hypothetical protein BGZ47_001206 [Haplosporangium gracile]|nr:hypothetical protein BGZ47_001206 [Haplosporangium gracile]